MFGKKKFKKRDDGGGGGGRPGQARKEFSAEHREKTLWVGNMDKQISEYMLIKLFSKYGTIEREEFMWWHVGEQRGAPRGYAFVEMKTREEALAAQRGADGFEVYGRKLRVRFAEERDTREYATIATREDAKDGEEEEDADGKVKPKKKSRSSGSQISTKDKIRAIEEKLRRMAQKGNEPENKPKKPPDEIEGYGKAKKGKSSRPGGY